MEIDLQTLSIAHIKDKVIKMFSSSEECLKFADDFQKEYGIELSSDPLYAFLNTVNIVGHREGLRHFK